MRPFEEIMADLKNALGPLFLVPDMVAWRDPQGIVHVDWQTIKDAQDARPRVRGLLAELYECVTEGKR